MLNRNKQLTAALQNFVKALVLWATTLPDQPGAFSVTVLGEKDMLNRTEIGFPDFVVGVDPTTPEGNPQQVVKRSFTVTQNGDTPVELFKADFEVGAAKPIVLLKQGTNVTLSLVDSDAANNASTPSVLTFNVTDVTAPSQPGSFQLTVLDEVAE